MPNKGCESIPGTEIKLGDHILGFGRATKVEPIKQVSGGAKFREVTFNNGREHVCWEGFKYHREVEIAPCGDT